MEKVCNKCGVLKPLSEYNKNSKKKDGVQTWCRECTKVRNNERYANDREHRDRIARNNRNNILRNRELVRKFKSQGCLLCSEKELVALDLHHLDPSTKEAHVSELLTYGPKKLLSEIEKCVILCANCHRKVHAGLLSISGKVAERSGIRLLSEETMGSNPSLPTKLNR